MINFNANYLEHSGGTKFYEVVRMSDIDASCYMVVKRWGKIADKQGGGQVKVERYTSALDAAKSVSDILTDKQKDKGAKGYYKAADINRYGLHAYDGTTIGNHDARLAVGGHYHDQNVEDAFTDFFGVSPSLKAAPKAGNPVIEETPVDRGDSWGSW